MQHAHHVRLGHQGQGRVALEDGDGQEGQFGDRAGLVRRHGPVADHVGVGGRARRGRTHLVAQQFEQQRRPLREGQPVGRAVQKFIDARGGHHAGTSASLSFATARMAVTSSMAISSSMSKVVSRASSRFAARTA